MKLDFRNTNSLWCSVAAETLYRAGVRHAVISPGSRNTPMTMALVAHSGIETTPVLDERSAGFFALGIAKRTRTPVVLLCTSGSAGAHYLPAIIEAKESGTPLIVITADRPPEMRDCASGQTIDQQKLFGGFVEFYHELAVPEPRLELLKYLRQTLRHAVERAMTDGAPVHLNAPFRDPLPPVADGTAEHLEAVVNWGEFFIVSERDALYPLPQSFLPGEFCRRDGVIVLGAGAREHGEVAALAAELGWPILVDGIAGRSFAKPSAQVVVAAYDAVLRSETAAVRLRPESVILIGELPTSKVLRAWLAKADPEIRQYSYRVDNRDSLHGRTRTVRLHREDALVIIPQSVSKNEAWARDWAKAEEAAQKVLSAAQEEPGFEGGFTQALEGALNYRHVLVVASSMPVRDLEYFAPVRADGPRVIANRGANGIDGTLSTALGVAHDGDPTVLLTGDLALLHDTNGFLIAPKLRGSLTVVVINNEGGGIFGHLPVAKFNPPFEEYWATPQRVDFGKLSAAYAVPHCLAATPAELREKLRAQVGDPGMRVIEVRTDRAKDVATRQRLFAAAALAAGDALV
jgi:2-succinyl-5-enolpyruvyl-6-hydroxy-3-cyclohexene-1-carboxylate synthase